ncbi:MAG: hypothetical protein KDD89_06235 [Anaerolineales bacterium]|nr:hypothetical protein [Anaerolineales bacterium]
MLSVHTTRRQPVLWLAALSILLVLFTACGGGESADEPAPSPTAVSFQSYNNEEMGFGLDYPQNWVVGTTPDGLIEFKSGEDVALDISYDGGSIIQVMTLPSFAFQDDPVADLDALKDDMLASVTSSGEEATIVQEPTSITVNGMPAAVTKIEARQGTVDGKAEIYLVEDEELTALVMMFFPKDDESEFRAILDNALNTLSLAETAAEAPEAEVVVEPTAEPAAEESTEETSAPPATSGDGVFYENEEFQVSLTHPEGWVLEDTDGYIALAPDQASMDAATFTGTGGMVIVGGALGDITPEEFLDLAADPAEFIDNPVEVVAMESFTINGHPAARMVFDGETEGEAVQAEFIALSEGGNAALVVIIYDPAVAGDLAVTMKDIANTIMLVPAETGADPGSDTAETTAPVVSADGVFYESEEFELALTYPEGWVLEDTEGYIALAPDQESMDAETFTGTGGMVVVGGALGATTPEDFLNDFATPEDFVDNPELLTEMESLEVNGQPAARVIYQGEGEGEPVLAEFIAIAQGDNLAFVVIVVDPDRAEDLGTIMEGIADTIVLVPAGGSSGEGTNTEESVAGDVELPTTDDATDTLSLGSDMVTFTSQLSLEDVVAFYREYASANGLVERDITTIISEDVISIVFDGLEGDLSLVIQAIPYQGATTVTVSVQDI